MVFYAVDDDSHQHIGSQMIASAIILKLMSGTVYQITRRFEHSHKQKFSYFITTQEAST